MINALDAAVTISTAKTTFGIATHADMNGDILPMENQCCFGFMEATRFGLLPGTVPGRALQKGFSTNEGKKLCLVPISAVIAARFSTPTKRVIRNRRTVCPAIIVRGVQTFRPVPSPRHHPQEYAPISVVIVARVPVLTKMVIRNRRTVCPAIIVRGVRILSNMVEISGCDLKITALFVFYFAHERGRGGRIERVAPCFSRHFG